MKTAITTQFLKDCMQFTIDVIDFCDHLTVLKKDSISVKMQDAAISVTGTLQSCKVAQKESDAVAQLKMAKKHIDETLYWLAQCHKSENFPRNDELLKRGKELDEKLVALLTKK